MASKRTTIADIAQAAGVSKTTVSFFLNGKLHKMSDATRDKIARAIDAMQYRPSQVARMLSAGKTGLIGVVVGDIFGGFSAQLVKGIDAVCRQQGYQMVVGSSDYDDREQHHIDRLLAMGLDGLIVQPTVHFSGKEALTGLPVVFVDSRPEGCHLPWVHTNNYHATQQVIAQCIRQGYDGFLMLTASAERMIPRLERTGGFLAALRHAPYPVMTHNIAPDTKDTDILSIVQTAKEKCTRLLVFVGSCYLLPPVFLALAPLREQIPSQIGLLGFDSTEWCDLSVPSVSTIVQPMYEEGVKAAQTLFAMLEQTAHPEESTLPCAVCFRGST